MTKGEGYKYMQNITGENQREVQRFRLSCRLIAAVGVVGGWVCGWYAGDVGGLSW